MRLVQDASSRQVRFVISCKDTFRLGSKMRDSTHMMADVPSISSEYLALSFEFEMRHLHLSGCVAFHSLKFGSEYRTANVPMAPETMADQFIAPRLV